ncbi:hypothetical protein BGW38_004926, partial [Lunasporangiospora selenospora]
TRSDSNNSSVSTSSYSIGHSSNRTSHMSHISQTSNSTFGPLSSLTKVGPGRSEPLSEGPTDNNHSDGQSQGLVNILEGSEHGGTVKSRVEGRIHPTEAHFTSSPLLSRQSTAGITAADAPRSPFARPLPEPRPSPRLTAQSNDRYSQVQASPRMGPRSAQRRRDTAPVQLIPMGESELPSLDQYEAMLQQMASPRLGPNNGSKESRTTASRRSEHDRMSRHTRKLQPPLRPSPSETELRSSDLSELTVADQTNNGLDSVSTTAQVSLTATTGSRIDNVLKKLRRRSSLPTSFGEGPTRLRTDLKRRSSEYHSPKDTGRFLFNADRDLPETPQSNEGALPEDSTSLPSPTATSSAVRRFLLHVEMEEEEEESSSPTHDDNDHSNLDRYRTNVNNTGSSPHISHQGPRVTPGNKSQKRLSSSLSQLESLSRESAGSNEDENDRQIEQFQKELRALQSSISTPRLGPSSSAKSTASSSSGRLRATTLSGAIVESGQTIRSKSSGLLSMEDTASSGRIVSTAPLRSTTPVSRPTTPNSGVLAATTTSSKKGTGSIGRSRGAKQSPPSSSSSLVSPPSSIPSRSRSVTVTSSGMALEGVFPQAPPPSSPLPSLPLPPPPLVASPPLPSVSPVGLYPPLTRSRRSSTSRELIPPTVNEENSEDPDQTLTFITPSSTPLPTPMFIRGADVSPKVEKMSQMKRRVSLLEREREVMEKSLLSRARDGTELQFQVDLLTLERDTLEKKMALLESAYDTAALESDMGPGHQDPRQKQNSHHQHHHQHHHHHPHQHQYYSDSSLAKASTRKRTHENLQEALRVIQDEKEVMLDALKEHQNQTRTGTDSMTLAEIESMRHKLQQSTTVERDTEVSSLKSCSSLRSSSSRGKRSRDSLELEISRLEGERGQLERRLTGATDEVSQLRERVGEKERDLARDQLARQELEKTLETLRVTTENQDREERALKEREGKDKEARVSELEQITHTLRAEKNTQQEIIARLQEQLESFEEQARQDQEKQRRLETTVQALEAKLESATVDHATEIDRLCRDQKEVLDRVNVEHTKTLSEVSERAKHEAVLEIQKSHEQAEHAQGEVSGPEAVSREKVWSARLNKELEQRRRFEEKIFELERSQAAHADEMESWTQTNRSLERQLAVEQLQLQEQQYQLDEAKRAKDRLEGILSDLDSAVMVESWTESHSTESRSVSATYAKQRQQWKDRIAWMEHKMAKTEEEAV